MDLDVFIFWGEFHVAFDFCCVFMLIRLEQYNGLGCFACVCFF